MLFEKVSAEIVQSIDLNKCQAKCIYFYPYICNKIEQIKSYFVENLKQMYKYKVTVPKRIQSLL